MLTALTFTVFPMAVDTLRLSVEEEDMWTGETVSISVRCVEHISEAAEQISQVLADWRTQQLASKPLNDWQP